MKSTRKEHCLKQIAANLESIERDLQNYQPETLDERPLVASNALKTISAIRAALEQNELLEGLDLSLELAHQYAEFFHSVISPSIEKLDRITSGGAGRVPDPQKPARDKRIVDRAAELLTKGFSSAVVNGILAKDEKISKETVRKIRAKHRFYGQLNENFEPHVQD